MRSNRLVAEGRTARPRLYNRPGWTFVEMMTVATIMVIISAIALPRIDTGRLRANAAVRGVRGALQQAQRAAILEQHDVLVSFDIAGNRVRIVDDIDNDRTIDSGESIRWFPLEEGAQFKAPPVGLGGGSAGAYVGANLISLDGMRTLVFRSNGSSSSNLDLYIGTAGGARSDFRAIRLTQSTGRTETYRLSDNTWLEGAP